MYDVVIVGAGPSGNYIAYRLAQLGYRVAVLEAREAIGNKVCCTGIISRECFELFSPDNSAILRKTNSAKFFAPSGQYVRLEKDSVQAYIIDRATFDRALAKKAQEAGADYFLQSKVTNITFKKKNCQIEVSYQEQKQIFEARVVVLACGFNSTLLKRLGMGRIGNFLFGAQTIVNTEVSEVEIYFDQEIASGGFAWLVPTSNSQGLAGVISNQDAYSSLNRLLLKLLAEGKINQNSFEIRQKVIPLGVLPRTYGNRVVVVGEAAGQVKPTTGGGIYFGLLCAELATNILHEALLADDLSSRRLSHYQKEWQAKIGHDLYLGYCARKIYSSLSNRQIERIFEIIMSNKIHEELLQGEGFSFDWHGRLILRALKQPKLLFGLITPQLLFSPTVFLALLRLICRSEVRTKGVRAKEATPACSHYHGR